MSATFLECPCCGAVVEPEREDYATPICYACLPPPKPIPGLPLRRAHVQGQGWRRDGSHKPAGSITWEEHVEAHGAYCKRHGNDQSAERMAERGGFGYDELVALLGHAPTTWRAIR